MLRKLLFATAIVAFLGSCTNLKPLAYTNSKQPSSAKEVNSDQPKEVKFLDDISVTGQAPAVKKETPEIKEQKKEVGSTGTQNVKTEVSPDKTTIPAYSSGISNSEIENSTSIQFKYALLLNTEVEYVKNLPLYQSIDEWYGTRYKLGGTSKKGVDCSALVQTIFISSFGITLPRTARDQYKASKRISRTELKEGDLLFFNTRGGVSHVGIYLQNNKFIHASVSNGVVISDMFDPYYVRKFIGAGRVERPSTVMLP